jgi:hypothetical protein
MTRRRSWLARRKGAGARSRGMRVQEHSVPCDGCTACCERDMVFLHPELGGRYALAHGPDGSCVYLTPTGCGIHPRRPAVCREMDCRTFLDMPQAQVEHLVASGALPAQVIAAARRLRRLHGTNMNGGRTNTDGGRR